MTHLAGTWALVRLIVARDRLRLLAWAGGVVALVAVTAATTIGLYPTQADLDEAAAAAADNPAALAFNGPDQALDTVGGQVAFQIGAFGLLVVGLMALLLVGRLTRAEEDSGRLELVRSMPVGRHAPLAAALLVVTGLLLVVGGLATASLVLQDLAFHGSVVLGASYLAFGVCFVGIAAVAAQIWENPRVVSGTVGAVLGASFALRAVGDMADGSASWASPMGFAQKARPFAAERWWPLLVLAVLGGGFVRAAVALMSRRDFGAGMLAARPGPPAAAPALRSPLGLAVRLNRGAVLWWGFGALWLGLVYGALADSIEDFVGDSESVRDLLARVGGASLTNSYLGTSLLVMALVAAAPGVQIALRLRTEEVEHRAEPVLATPVPRSRLLGSYVVVALAGSALTMAAAGFGLGASYAIVRGDLEQLPRLLAAGAVHVPAAWLLVGVAVLLVGAAPRWVAAIWGALAACFVMAMFGTLLDLPRAVLDASPFEHTPNVPATGVDPLPIVVLAALAAVLLAGGLVAFGRRDLRAA